MNELTEELHTLALELAAAGLFAAVDPGEVLTMVNRGGVCALVEPTTSYSPVTFGLDFGLVIPVWLITSGPYDADAVERLDGALMLAWPVTRPAEPVTRGTWESGDTSMPALLIPTPRHVDCAP